MSTRTQCQHEQSPTPQPKERLPHLAALRLSEYDYASLRAQGWVSQERLPSGRICFKLRFRRTPSGRQSVRYIGTDAAVADEVRQELAALQAETRNERELKRIRKAAFRQLRDAKKKLGPLLAPEGFIFYGFELRASRGSRRAASGDCTATVAAN